MKVLVIGATGFIGNHLVRALAREGHQVVAASRCPRDWGDAPKVIPCGLDITNSRSFRDLPESIDVVIHAAATRQDPVADRHSIERLLKVNVQGTLNVLHYVHWRRIPRLVYCSSMSVYSPDQALPVGEDGATYPSDTLDSAYGITKLCAELLCARMHWHRLVKCFRLRLARVYGPGADPKTLIPMWVRQAARQEEIVVHGGGERSTDLLYIDDAIQGIMRAVQAATQGGVYNLGSGEETTWKALVEAIISVFSPPGMPSPILYVEQGDRSRCYLDISRARHLLGYEPRFSLVEGLQTWRTLENLT